MPSLLTVTSAYLGVGVLGLGWLFWRFFVKADASVNLLWCSSHLGREVLKGKVVWITGSSQGIGLEVAKKLVQLGAHVVLSSRSMDKLQKAQQECQALADENSVKIVQLDLTAAFEDLERSTQAAVETFGKVDVLIHNAGVTQHGLMQETQPQVVEEMFRLNTLGPILLTRAFIPYMVRQQRGHLVVVSSMAAKVPSPGQTIYAATKCALHGFFNSLQTELADQGVRVTVICPGPVAGGESDMKRTVYGPSGLQQQLYGSRKGKISVERAVDLIAVSVVHQLQESWISKQPVLGLGYIMQYIPFLGWIVLNKYGPTRAKAIHSGQSGYDVASIVNKSSQKKR